MVDGDFKQEFSSQIRGSLRMQNMFHLDCCDALKERILKNSRLATLDKQVACLLDLISEVSYYKIISIFCEDG